jgi:hypothetical protein
MNLELFIPGTDLFLQIISYLVSGPLEFLKNRTRKLMAESLSIKSDPDPQHSQVFDQTALLRRSLSLFSLYLAGRILLELAVKALTSLKVTVRYSLDVLMEDFLTKKKEQQRYYRIHCSKRVFWYLKLLKLYLYGIVALT